MKLFKTAFLIFNICLCINSNAQHLTETDFIKELDDAKAREMETSISLRIKSYRTLPDDYYNRGALRLLWFKDSAGALQDFDKAIQIDKNKFAAYVNRAAIREGWKDYANAEKDLGKAIALQPSNPVVYNNRGYLYHLQEKYELALLDFDKSIQLEKPDEIEVIRTYLNKTETLRMMDRIKDAEAVFDQVIKLFPKEYKLYVNRSDFYITLGNYQAALRDLDYAVDISQSPDMLIVRARFKDDDIDDDKGAIMDCDAAIDMNPYNAKYYYARSRPLYDMKEYSSVVKACTKAISLDSNYYEAYVMRANAYDYLFEYENAQRDYRKATLLQPKNEAAYIEYAASFNKRQMYNKSIDVFKQLLVYDSGNIKIRGQVIFLKMAIRDFEGAIVETDKIIKQNPLVAEAYYLRGIAKDSLGKRKEACSDIQTADKMNLPEAHEFMTKNCKSLLNPKLVEAERLMLESKEKELDGDLQGSLVALNKLVALIPDSCVPYFNRGVLKRKMEDSEGGIADLKKAVSLNKRFAEAWVSMANEQYKIGKVEDAINSYKKAIEANPEFPMSYFNLATLFYDQNRVKESIQYGEQAVKKDKNYLKAYLLLGEAYLKLGNKDASCQAYRNASRIGSGKADTELIMNDCK